MKFSIVTPSYNQGAFIGRTLESVAGQGIASLEHLVMDGGSRDDTCR
ncbi:MAG: glycosyltransferase, partial [Gammaproteobacteria bacterium]